MALHWAWGVLVLVPMVLVGIAVVVVVIVAATRSPGAPSHGLPPAQGAPGAMRETPLEILARRFASGEITAEEYQRARDLLQGGSIPPAPR